SQQYVGGPLTRGDPAGRQADRTSRHATHSATNSAARNPYLGAPDHRGQCGRSAGGGCTARGETGRHRDPRAAGHRTGPAHPHHLASRSATGSAAGAAW
ncbi:hypothetical protein CKA56_16745, partial [Arcobacter venerupis]